MQIHYFAAARAAAGTSQEHIEGFATLAEALEDAATRHTGTTDAGLRLADILDRCSFLLDGKRSDTDASLEGIERIDVLPPFAGG